MGGRLGSVAVGVASCRGFGFRRAVRTLSSLSAGLDTRKSLEVSSCRLSDSGISLQIRPKANEKTRRMQNLPRNRIGNQIPFLANPTLKLSHGLRLLYSAQILSVNKNLRTKKTCLTQSCFRDDETGKTRTLKTVGCATRRHMSG
jgi:hypothetical protein